MAILQCMPGVCGRYTDAVEWEVTKNKCKSLKCDIMETQEASTYYTYPGYGTVGYAEGPGGRTTYYAPETKYGSTPGRKGWKCLRCERKFMTDSDMADAPKVTIEQTGNKRVMKIAGKGSSSMCGNPLMKDNGSDLAAVWNELGYTEARGWSCLEDLWRTARKLDAGSSWVDDRVKPFMLHDESMMEPDSKMESDIEHVVERTSGCCCIMQ